MSTTEQLKPEEKKKSRCKNSTTKHKKNMYIWFLDNVFFLGFPKSKGNIPMHKATCLE